jgi:hypothetical protein
VDGDFGRNEKENLGTEPLIMKKLFLRELAIKTAPRIIVSIRPM